MLTTSLPNALLLARFNYQQVQYLVVGGLAVRHYCLNRETNDLDVLVNSTVKNAEKVKNALLYLHEQHTIRCYGPGDLKHLCPRLIEPGKCVKIREPDNPSNPPHVCADILTPELDFSFCSAFDRSVESTISDVATRIMSRFDLIQYKRKRIDYMRTHPPEGDSDTDCYKRRLQKEKSDLAMLLEKDDTGK